MKKLVMQDGEPKFILDTNNADDCRMIDLLDKHGYQICDVKNVNDFTFWYNCKAYFDPDGEYKTKDGRSFHLDYDLVIIDEPNIPISREILSHSYDGKDGINFTLPIYTSLVGIINVALDSLSESYPEDDDDPVGIVESEYIYAIYSCSVDNYGYKMMSLPYYTKDIKAAQELINLENIIHRLYFNGKEKGRWYEISEIDVQSNKTTAEFIKSTSKEITLEDVKNIKLCVTAYITTDKHKMNKYDTKFFSPVLNRTLYISLYPHQPKIEGLKLNDADYIDDTGFLHMSRLFIVNLENAEIDKKIIYSYMVRKSEKLLMTKNQRMK